MNRVVVLGNVTLDIVQRVERFPAAGETILASDVVRCPGGKGLNQAVAAARTGAPTRLVAPVGRDSSAEFLAHFLRAELGLDVNWIVGVTQTDLSTIWVDRHGENMIVSSAHCARSTTIDRARSACAMLEKGDVLLMQGNLPSDTTRAAAELARELGAVTILNTAPIGWDMQPLLTLFDVVIANEVEAAILVGAHSDQAASRLLADHILKAAVVTLGSRGAQIASRDGSALIPAPQVAALDTSGAGDVMVGSFAGLLAQGATLNEAVEIAVHAASLSVARAGTTTSFPSRVEFHALSARFRQMMNERSEDA